MNDITSCLNNLFTVVRNKSVSHKHERSLTSEKYKLKEDSDDDVCGQNPIHIQNLYIKSITINFGAPVASQCDDYDRHTKCSHHDDYDSSSYNDSNAEINARMNFFRANSP